jgi:PAS domain S-box-containing protein
MDEKSRSGVAADPPPRGATSGSGGAEAVERLLSIVELLPDATFAVDLEGRVVAWNRACERLTGVDRAAVLGRGERAYAEPFTGQRLPMLIDMLEAAPDEKRVLDEDVVLKGDVLYSRGFNPRVKGGRGAYLASLAFRLLDRDGRRCGAVEVLRDVTDQGLSVVEHALCENELKYRTLFETAADAILLMRFDRFIDCNARTLAVFGCSREEIVGASPFKFSPPRQPDGRPSEEKALEKIRLALEQGPQSFEWEHCRLDGTTFPAEVSLNRLELGDEVLLQAIVRDVGDRERMERKLRESETQLSLILNNVSDVIFAVAVEPDGEFRFSSVNRRFLEATGLAEGQVVGARVSEVIPEAAHQLVFSKYREAIRSGQPAHWEEVSRYPAGVKIGHVTVVPVYDAQGTCTQLVGMVHDVSERKQAEEQVRRLNEDLRRHADELEQRVQARTAQLAARNQELKEFAYTVSHDLKAPLRGIAGYANELARKHQAGLGERARFCLAQILAASTNLDRLIEDLLHYSRLDAETPSLSEVDLRRLIEAVLRDRQLAINEQHVEVSVEVPFGTLRSWERGLVQVLTNLIDNAIKYSRHANPPRLRISAAELEQEWRLAVSDNGIGFEMRYHDRIFGLFNRLVRMEDYEGTGAGLAIVKKVLDKQGGRIWAESVPGRGSTFFVALPRPREAGGAAAAGESS